MALEPAGRGPQIMAVYLFFLSICTVTTWLRVYCRAFVVKQFGIDDGLALVAWVSTMRDLRIFTIDADYASRRSSRAMQPLPSLAATTVPASMRLTYSRPWS